ncbi:conserved hypothetical protein [delta proteobacterium NaphS2]|nr:conserved hypothetical protein [delta proteobacterium NaphS2]
MLFKRCLQLLTVLLVIVLSGEVGLAKKNYVSENSGGDTAVAEQEKPGQMTRVELETALMRFAQTFIRGFTKKVRSLEDHELNKKIRFEISRAELRTINIMIDLVTGPDAVDNLLDMVVFVTLSRTTVEKRWDTKVLGKDKGGIPEFFKQMEKEIWNIAGNVLTPRHQKELRNLIVRWQAKNPGEYYIQEVGFNRISNTMGKTYFEDAGKPGFLLPEMSEATRSIDEARNLAERLSFFAKYLPSILLSTAETGVYGFLNEPETIQLLSDIKRLTTAVEEIGSEVKQFPDRLSKEREKLVDDLLESEGKLQTLAKEIQKSLAMGDEMAISTNEAAATMNQTVIAIDKVLERIQAMIEPGSLDITKWFETVHEVTEAAKQTQALVVMTDRLLTNMTTESRLTQIQKSFDALLLRVFMWTALLIVFFFLVLFGYRFLSRNLIKSTTVPL